MKWSKAKKMMEEKLAPSLKGQVAYTVSSYRFAHDKSGRSNLMVDGVDIFNISKASQISWYLSVQEARKDLLVELTVSEEEAKVVRQQKIPEERVMLVASQRKQAIWADVVYMAQSELFKTEFTKEAERFLSSPLEQALESEEILMNIFALIDRRLGKKRLLNLQNNIKMKHPAVQFFYQIRLNSEISPLLSRSQI